MEKRISLIFAALSGALLGYSSHFPETWISALLAWSGLLGFLFVLTSTDYRKLASFVFGFTFSLVAFYWLTHTLENFGEFPYLIAFVLFIIFSIVSSFQFVILAWIYTQLRKRFCFVGLIALAWMTSEFLVPRLFPWTLAYTQVAFRSFSGLAEFVGAYPLSGLMVFWGEVILSFLRSGFEKKKAVVFTLSLLFLALGFFADHRVKDLIKTAPSVKLAVVQGNISTDDKGDSSFYDENIRKYRKLTKKALSEGAELVVWPESVVNKWLPMGLKSVTAYPELDPYPGLNVPIFYGGLSYDKRPESEFQEIAAKLKDQEFSRNFLYRYYNSAFYKKASGRNSWQISQNSSYGFWGVYSFGGHFSDSL